MDTKRFHSTDYKRQVSSRRTYSRPVRKPAEGFWPVFFDRIGLGTWLRKILAVVVLGVLVYLIYFAKFLKIDAINISGTAAGGSVAQGISANFNKFAGQYVYGLPENNILFFDAARFKRGLLASDFDVSSVSSVRRASLHAIAITIVPRAAAFNLAIQDNFFVLNSDGVIGSALAGPNSNLKTVIDTADQNLTPGQSLFSPDKAAFLEYVDQNFSSEIQASIDHYEIPGVASSDLILFTQSGAQALFNSSGDPKVSLQRFFTIWSGLTADQHAKVAYIDLRFDPKAFLCYQGTACALDAAPQPQQAAPQSQNQNGQQTTGTTN